MSDLSVLIRLHKHELDTKRRALGELYTSMATLERQRRTLERMFELEKQAVDASGEVHFTFMQYTDKVKKERLELDQLEALLEQQIDLAKESLMETFSEMKKYEMTQEERERIEEEERSFREAKRFDDIGIEGFRRKDEDE